MKVALGSGDDKLITGDTLGGAAKKDAIDGGEGADHVTAVFTTAGTRQPVMTNVEEMTVTFNAAATVDFHDTSDLETINVLSSPDFRMSFRNMDSTVSEINVFGDQASNQAHRLFFDKGGDVAVNWKSEVASDTDAGELIFQDVQGVNFAHSGDFDTFFSDVTGDGNSTGWEFDDSLQTLAIANNGPGDLYLLGAGGSAAVAGTRRMTDLTIAAKDGDIAISGDIDTIFNLENLTLSADNGAYVALVDIGSPVDDINGGTGIGRSLDNVQITTGSGNLTTLSFNDLRADNSFISTINIDAGNSSTINIGRIVAQSISDMTVTLAQNSNLNWTGGFDDIDMTLQGGSLIVSGSGDMSNLNFANEAFATMDFGGMSANNVDVNWASAFQGSTVTGTAFADVFVSGRGGDTGFLGADADFWQQNGGSDDLTLGAGSDFVVYNNVIELGDVVDQTIRDWQGGVNGDTLEFDISDLNGLVWQQFPTVTANLVNLTGADAGAGQGDVLAYQASIDVGSVSGAGGITMLNLVGSNLASVGDVEAALGFNGSTGSAGAWTLYDKNAGGNPSNAAYKAGDSLLVTWSDGTDAHVGIATVANVAIADVDGQGGANDAYFTWVVNEIVDLVGINTMTANTMGDANYQLVA